MQPDRLTDLEKRLRVMEVLSHQFNDQLAELTVQTRELPKQIGEAVETAVKAGMRQGLSDLLAKGKRDAADGLFRGVVGILKTFLSRWVVIAIIVLIVVKAAGVQAAATVFNWLTGGK